MISVRVYNQKNTLNYLNQTVIVWLAQVIMLQLLAISDNFDVGIKDVKDGVKDGICAVNIILIATIHCHLTVLSGKE